tara:strand:- start:1259 stop:1657 length:399 start_codon:yes stop_codon:yes gene_type:complete
MNREELLKHHTEVCARALEIMQVKNHDYAGKNGEEPFANFERCEAMGVCSTETGFLVRVIDKVSRLSTFVDAGELKVKGETWKDAVLDIMNYMILFSAFVSDKEKEDLPMGTEEFLIEELEVTPNTVMHHPV